jgi:hypothetical protein
MDSITTVTTYDPEQDPIVLWRRHAAALEVERDRYREALHTIAYWRGALTAADAGTMRMTARAALDAATSRTQATTEDS